MNTYNVNMYSLILDRDLITSSARYEPDLASHFPGREHGAYMQKYSYEMSMYAAPEVYVSDVTS